MADIRSATEAEILATVQAAAEARRAADEAYVAAILDAWNHRVSLSRIAERTGTSAQAVNRLIHRHKA